MSQCDRNGRRCAANNIGCDEPECTYGARPARVNKQHNVGNERGGTPSVSADARPTVKEAVESGAQPQGDERARALEALLVAAFNLLAYDKTYPDVLTGDVPARLVKTTKALRVAYDNFRAIPEAARSAPPRPQTNAEKMRDAGFARRELPECDCDDGECQWPLPINKLRCRKPRPQGDEREAFEADISRRVPGINLDRDGNDYYNLNVHHGWQGWQARATQQPSTPPQSEETELLRLLHQADKDVCRLADQCCDGGQQGAWALKASFVFGFCSDISASIRKAIAALAAPARRLQQEKGAARLRAAAPPDKKNLTGQGRGES